MDTNEKYYDFLDNLRESGVTNMFGATPYLMEEFSDLSKVEAREILKSWMDTFSDRHPLWCLWRSNLIRKYRRLKFENFWG